MNAPARRRWPGAVARNLRDAAIVALVTLVLVEIASAAFVHWNPGYLVYEAPTRERFEHALRDADPTLGWVRSASHTGARFDPFAAADAAPCIELYGDSFAFGYEVRDDQAWPALLGRRLGCRVLNFAEPGYGIDQATLRHAGNSPSTATRVLLAIFPEDIARDLSQDFALFTDPGLGIALKPRYRLTANGDLAAAARPAVRAADYAAYVADPARFLTAEHFLPGSAAFGAKVRKVWPRTLTLWRALHHPQWLARLTDESWYAPFYTPGRPDGALELATALIARFAATVEARGQQATVLVLPSARNLRQFRRDGTWVYQPLLDAVRARGIDIRDAGPALNARLHGRAPCTLYCPSTTSDGHYPAAGNAAVADWVADLMPPARSPE